MDPFEKYLDDLKERMIAFRNQSNNVPNMPKKNVECKKCNDVGIYLDKNGFGVECSCKKRKALIARFQSCQIPESMLNHSFSKLNLQYYSKDQYHEEYQEAVSYYTLATHSINLCKQYAEEYTKGKINHGLYLYGPVGSGKTFLACCIANYILTRTNIDLLFVVVPDLLQRIRSSWNDKSVDAETEHSLVEKVSSVQFLILDDLGAHNYTEWTLNTLYKILNYRANRNLPTIITSNLDLIMPINPRQVQRIAEGFNSPYTRDLMKRIYKQKNKDLYQEDPDQIISELAAYVGDRVSSRINQLCIPVHLSVQKDIRKQIQDRISEKEKKKYMENLRSGWSSSSQNYR
ncbi:ATP-binding protein [Desulfotomaculum defluvii]